MKKRLFKNYLTSVPGIIIFAGACYAYFISKAIDLIAFTSLVSLSGLLLRAKDSIIPGAAAKE